MWIFSNTAVWLLSVPFFVVLHPCTLLNIVFEHKKTPSMCWDFDVLVFLHVVCVDVAVWLDGLGLKKEFVTFRLSDVSRLSSDVPFLFLFSIPKGPYCVSEVLSVICACPYICIDVVSQYDI